ncbi:hypothetical protein HZS_393 [Henneguya salminicola]|nr:hypothetical protein HZS_393 [Henneguya salminicola]
MRKMEFEYNKIIISRSNYTHDDVNASYILLDEEKVIQIILIEFGSGVKLYSSYLNCPSRYVSRTGGELRAPKKHEKKFSNETNPASKFIISSLVRNLSTSHPPTFTVATNVKPLKTPLSDDTRTRVASFLDRLSFRF